MATKSLLKLVVSSVLFVTAAGWAFGEDRREPLPEELQGVGITEHPEAVLPLDRPFVDQDGRQVMLGDYFGRGRPVVLTLNYSSCPMLCHVQRDGLIEVLQKLDMTAGKEFDIVTISIDPRETSLRAHQTRAATLKAYGRPQAAQGWHFLTGTEVNIQAVAQAVGFGYRFVPARQEYAHSAALILCTPQGRVGRYLYGVKYDAQTLRLSLLETAQGKIGSTLDQIILYCFHYDANSKRYAPAAMRIMRVGGGSSALILGLFLTRAWLNSRTRTLPDEARPEPEETVA
jgi:protein SCO1/2